jgi:hypothetical protein
MSLRIQKIIIFTFNITVLGGADLKKNIATVPLTEIDYTVSTWPSLSEIGMEQDMTYDNTGSNPKV